LQARALPATRREQAERQHGGGYPLHHARLFEGPAGGASQRTVRRGVSCRPACKLALLATVVAAWLAAAAAARAATPPPGRSIPLPRVPLRAVYTVETNKLGQVVRIRAARASENAGFNAVTRGNALQAFIRRPNGTALAGVYKLIYDYSPKSRMVRRNVQLVHAGGVDPNAKGAVTVELERAAKSAPIPRPANLPDFDKIIDK
jgi:hypothetical protein